MLSPVEAMTSFSASICSRMWSAVSRPEESKRVCAPCRVGLHRVHLLADAAGEFAARRAEPLVGQRQRRLDDCRAAATMFPAIRSPVVDPFVGPCQPRLDVLDPFVDIRGDAVAGGGDPVVGDDERAVDRARSAG